MSGEDGDVEPSIEDSYPQVPLDQSERLAALTANFVPT